MDALTTVKDQSGKILGVLENAGDLAYALPWNDLWTGSFTLPANDPKNAYCEAFNQVQLVDGNRDIGLHRIITMPDDPMGAVGGKIQYGLEHVIATLLDDNLFGYHEIGGEGIYTRDVIEYILARQETVRWVLGDCEFSDEFTYKFENAQLLPALLSLGNYLTDDYTWVFDTSQTPWVIHLRHADTATGCGIYYRRNLRGVHKSMDATTLVTRLYGLGYGEGVNQLTIKEINGGKPYLDADTKAVWGIKSAIYPDTRIEDAKTLKARMLALLEKLKNPYISYTVSAIDLARLTGYSWDRFMPGMLVHVDDKEHGISFDARIISISKANVRGRSGDVEITIANAARDAASSLNSLADRVGINQLYSQGATNLYSQQYADNASAAKPAVMKVYVPTGCVRINQMLLYWSLEKFRAYETGAAAGGGSIETTTSAGGSTQTSTTNGGGTQTSAAGGEGTTGQTGGAQTSNTFLTTDTPNTGVTGSNSATTGSSSANYTGSDYGDGYHNHSMYHTHAGGSHSHSMYHTHEIQNHNHTIPYHSHSIAAHTHTVTIPGHSHSLTIPGHSHEVTIGTHTHSMVFGIYEGSKAASVSILVDGTAVPAAAITGKELDVVAYLAKNADGKITRGTWHTIAIVPDALTRIEANLFVQTFVQSRGGGDY